MWDHILGVIGLGPAITQHPLVNTVDATPGTLSQTNSLDDVSQQGVARLWWGHQQIIEIDPFDKAAGAADIQTAVIQFDMDCPEATKVPVDERVDVD